MSILNSIVKKVVDKQCSPPREVLEAARAYLDNNPVYCWIEDILNITQPSSVGIMLVIDRKDELADKDQYSALQKRMDEFEEVIRETYTGEMKIVLYPALRVFEPGNKFGFSLKPVAINEVGELQTIDPSGLMLSDIGLIFNNATGGLQVYHSRYFSTHDQVLYGKSRLAKIIKLIYDKGYSGGHSDAIELAEMSGQSPHNVTEFLSGKVLHPKAEFLEAIAKVLEIPVEDITPGKGKEDEESSDDKVTD